MKAVAIHCIYRGKPLEIVQPGDSFECSAEEFEHLTQNGAAKAAEPEPVAAAEPVEPAPVKRGPYRSKKVVETDDLV